MGELIIVSGGQTGADRAALDWAVSRGIPHRGWCPKGKLAEDGTIAPCYQLQETTSKEYVQRTEWNVRNSDATVIFSLKPKLSGGSKKTEVFAQKHQKAGRHLAAPMAGSNAPRLLQEFVRKHRVRILNVAGPRASHEPTIGQFVQETLEKAFPRK